jgi:hypothetical protein
MIHSLPLLIPHHIHQQIQHIQGFPECNQQLHQLEFFQHNLSDQVVEKEKL